MATNITNRPKLVNGLANEIFNNADFGTSDDVKYVKRTGDVISGQLSVAGLNSTGGTNQFSTNINLPTTYTSLPSLTQIGGGTKEQFSGSMTSSGNLSLLTFSIPTGCYLITYNITLHNPTGGTNIGVNLFVTGIVSSGIYVDNTNGTRTNTYNITLNGGTGSTSYTSINNTIYMTNVNAPTNQNIAIYYSGSGAVNYSGTLTRIRLG